MGRKRVNIGLILGALFILVLAIYLMTVIIVAGLPLLMLFVIYVVVLAVLSQRHFLMLKIGNLERNFATKSLYLPSVKETIAYIHFYSNDL